MANNIRFNFGSKMWGKFRKGNNDSIMDYKDTTLNKKTLDYKSTDYLLESKDAKVIGNMDIDSSKNFAIGGRVGQGDRERRLAIKNEELSYDLQDNLDPYTYLGNNKVDNDVLLILNSPHDPDPAGKTIFSGDHYTTYPNDYPPQSTPCNWCRIPDPDNPGKCISYEKMYPCARCDPKMKQFTIEVTYDANSINKTLAGKTFTRRVTVATGEEIKPSRACEKFQQDCKNCVTFNTGNGVVECVGQPRAKNTPCDECIDGTYEGCERHGAYTCVNGECKPDDCGGEVCDETQCMSCESKNLKNPKLGKHCVFQCKGSTPDCLEVFTGMGQPRQYGCGCAVAMNGCQDPAKPDLDTDSCSCRCDAEVTLIVPLGKTQAQICNEDTNKHWDGATCSCVTQCDPPCEAPEVCAQVEPGVYSCMCPGEPAGASSLSSSVCSNYSLTELPYSLLP
tara:strand:- start:316 stop:1662 length:1347 start_codon:yes stop_codon:yes gene_type:complete